MARHRFAGDLTGVTFAVGPDGYAKLQSSILRFYDAKTDGAEYTDLALDAAGLQPVIIPMTSTPLGDPTALIGAIPAFYGPDSVWAMWAEGDGGPRQLIVANDLPTYIVQAIDDAARAQADATKALANSGKAVIANPSATWSITHAMPNKPGVTIVDDAGSQLYAEVTYPDATTIVIAFCEPVAGTAYLRG